MSGGGGGRIILSRAVLATATMNSVTENLTPSECADRDAIAKKQIGDWTDKDFRTMQGFISCAYKRCSKK